MVVCIESGTIPDLSDGFYVTYDHLVTGETIAIRENGATSGIGVLATFGFDPGTAAGQLGLRTSLVRGNGTVTAYGHDAVSRLASLGQDLAGTAHDLTLGFASNPASQLVSNPRSNDACACSATAAAPPPRWRTGSKGGKEADGFNACPFREGKRPETCF